MSSSKSQNGASAINGYPIEYSRTSELEQLLKRVLAQIIPFMQSADDEVQAHHTNSNLSRSSIVEYHQPQELASILSDTISISANPAGQDAVLYTLESMLKYSVNTSAPGFLDKLYSAPVPPGIAADLILSMLNTNVHVYGVSPVLTLIEKSVTKALASLFGLDGPRAGGINVQGGSASNMTSIVVARNTLYPQTKVHGNCHNGLDLVMFTSAHGHYSIEKAAQQCGFGSAAVIPVSVDPVTGTMIPSELEKKIIEAKKRGKTPFYVNATAGTTVLGSFDPFLAISAIAKRNNMWMHIDGAWGGSFIFSEKLAKEKLRGCELANSIAVNPHKMMGVPVTCSFLLANDLKQFHSANTLRAGYLFHDEEDEILESRATLNGSTQVNDYEESDAEKWEEPNDLADLTLQCGRRGDSLKLFLAWQYYGTNGYREKIENAHEMASHLVEVIAQNADFVLVSKNPPPCLQVCFYYAPGGRYMFGEGEEQITPPGFDAAVDKAAVLGRMNSKVTERITKALVSRGFMIDFAPALEGQAQAGKFFRVVVNIQTHKETIDRLVDQILDIGRQIVQDIKSRHGR